MSFQFEKPEPDALPIANVIKMQNFDKKRYSSKKYKFEPNKAIKSLYVKNDDYLPVEDRVKVMELDPKKGERFEVVPYAPEDQVNSFFVFGKQGSGKSFVCRHIADQIRYMLKYNPLKIKEMKEKDIKFEKDEPYVYLFSGNRAHDKAFDNMRGLFKVKNDPESYHLYETLEYDKFENCICIFDDWETLEPYIRQHFIRLITQLLSFSRKKNVYVITITHDCMLSALTKPIITDTQTIVAFHQNDWPLVCKFLKNKIFPSGEGTELIEKIKNSLGRTVVIRNSVPTFILTEFAAYKI